MGIELLPPALGMESTLVYDAVAQLFYSTGLDRYITKAHLYHMSLFLKYRKQCTVNLSILMKFAWVICVRACFMYERERVCVYVCVECVCVLSVCVCVCVCVCLRV